MFDGRWFALDDDMDEIDFDEEHVELASELGEYGPEEEEELIEETIIAETVSVPGPIAAPAPAPVVEPAPPPAAPAGLSPPPREAPLGRVRRTR